MNDEITVLDLFSGIGGFSLGLESAGPFRTVAFCEREPYCQAVLRKHWPDTPIFDDVRTIPTDGLGRVNIIAGGWPCQPWSQAGQQRGAADDRDLWPEMARLVAELQPKWVIGENVRGFVSQSMGLKRSLSDLESLGYQAAPFVIPACAVDAPHRRDRVWIIAHANVDGEPDGTVNEKPRSGQLVANADSKRRNWSAAEYGPCRREFVTGNGEAVGDTNRSDCSGFNVSRFKGQARLAFRSRWAVEPDVCRVAYGVSNRVDRLKALGNAVVPQVVAQIGRAILAAEYAG